jgi:hypothetical protein
LKCYFPPSDDLDRQGDGRGGSRTGYRERAVESELRCGYGLSARTAIGAAVVIDDPTRELPLTTLMRSALEVAGYVS